MLSKAIILATIAMLILIFLKVPVFVSMMSGAMVYFCMEPAATLQIAAQRLTSGMESVSILAAPFFIFTGVMINRSGFTIVRWLGTDQYSSFHGYGRHERIFNCRCCYGK